MANTTIYRPRWVVGWTLASLLGFALGFAVVFIGGWAVVQAVTGNADGVLGDDGIGFYIQLILGFGVAGAAAATGQWLLLRRRVTKAGRWVLGGALGFAVVAALYLLLFERVPLVINEVIHNAAGGAVLGLIQMPVVRRLTGRSRAWVAVTALAMVLGGAIAALLRQLGLGDDLGGPLAVACLSLATGVVLSGWIDRPQPLTDQPATPATAPPLVRG
jgi:hypothetical protein